MLTLSKYKVVLVFLALYATSLTFTSRENNVLPFHSAPHRLTSVYLGNRTCRWTPPKYDMDDDINFHKTLVAGYPSGDKRLTFLQLEGISGYSAKDEWDFYYHGITNHPFIKANYPHHEGIWGWEQEADQVILVVRNIRRIMVEYHDILWDIDFALTYDVSRENSGNLYRERPPLEDFVVWRDNHVLNEINWYGWFIDYWMEGGLMRDMFTNKITTPEHWNMIMRPEARDREDMTYDLIVGNDTIVTPSYDPHCPDDISGGCEPIQIISAERLLMNETGPQENRKIAETLVGKNGFENLIDEDAWECIWEELIINKRGVKTFLDREGISERDYYFSEEMLEKMLEELDRLITKYSLPEWNHKHQAENLVDLLSEHYISIEEELNEVSSGRRRLKYDDFLGPETRKKRTKKMKDKHLYW